jgi:aspartate racemase
VTEMQGRPLIAIISGLGPLAGEDVLDKAVAYAAGHYHAVEDVDYPDIVLFSHGIDDFDCTGTTGHRFVDELRKVVQEVDLHHPSVVGIACNTAHLYVAELQACTSAMLVNLIEETAETANMVDHDYLLLSSSTTRRTGLYHEALRRRGVRFRDVSEEEQLQVDEVVHTVMAHELDAAAHQLDEVVNHLAGDLFNAVIAGCTELPMALKHADVARKMPVIDSNEVLARALVDRDFALRSLGATHAGTT